MNSGHGQLRQLIRVLSDREDWPSQGEGWISVPLSSEPTNVDVLLVSREGPVAELALNGLPIVVAPVVDTPLKFLKAAVGVVFIDDAAETVGKVIRHAGRV